MEETRTPWKDVLILSIIAVILYHIGLFLVFFLVPMQILYVRRGEAGYKFGSLVFLVGVLLAKTFMLIASRDVPVEPLLVSLDFLLPLAFLAALYVLNADHLGHRRLESPVALSVDEMPGTGAGEAPVLPIRIPTRLLIATVAGAVISLPLVIYLLNSQTLVKILTTQFQLAEKMLSQSGDAVAANGQTVNADQLVRMAMSIFTRVYVFGFFLMIYLNWYIGTHMGRRTQFGSVRLAAFQDRLRPEGLKMPDYMIWLLLVSWGSVILSLYVEIGPLQYVVWNLALVVGFLYGLQGIGIVQYLMRKRSVSRGLRYVLIIAVVALLFVPVANLVVLIGFPLFGVSETWIHYRRIERSEE